MTKEEKKTPARAEETAAATPERLEYTGGTSGSIRAEDGTVLVAHVNPGDVLEPENATHRRALLKTGHFAPTRRRATTDGAPTSPDGQE